MPKNKQRTISLSLSDAEFACLKNVLDYAERDVNQDREDKEGKAEQRKEQRDLRIARKVVDIRMFYLRARHSAEAMLAKK